MTDYRNDPRFPGPDPYAPLKDLPTFTVTSTDFACGEQLPVKHRGGQSVSPQLSWDPSELPAGTKSLAITCFDPDAPTASGFWHWGVFNIPVSCTSVATGAGGETLAGVPEAVNLKGDSLRRGYYGSNPPAGHGPHRYLFAVHAVDTETLDIAPNSPVTVLGFNLYFHSLARAIYWGWDEN
ncbi:MAG: YbhB/YbcL family Raf kinase inhibitor-like protein [Corynebacterium pyruviciproducens]|uniref:YbhB/YbcL family Raf kinase inhibitor-like protein n=1 Tax=Corynebacterium pyruviciproducens TaxID=598660 RepID=UPI0023F2E670|nr:YbhB/YbcL family Raf kinase inhibitor-like protein [Corynebacterium pyruviciproducens]